MEGFCPLASGSRGNCLYIGTNRTKILVDAGITGNATTQKLSQLGVDIDDIKAILISHDHADHVQGLKTLALRKKIPVFANSQTAQAICHSLQSSPKFKIFTRDEPFIFEGIEIYPFSVQHDAIDPVGFTLKIDDLKIGICTDLGYPTSLVKANLRNCDYLVIESNHEPHMVHACNRPVIYKQRVLGRNGHLSNESCASLLAEVVNPKLRHIHLAHLSSECNSPQTAIQHVQKKIGTEIPISIALQEKISERVLF